MPVRERGISCHVVGLVTLEGALHALKELPDPQAEREARLLRQLAADGEPAMGRSAS